MKEIKRIVKRIAYSQLPSSTALMFHHIDDGRIIPRSGCKLEIDRFMGILDSGIPFISLDEYLEFGYKKSNPCTITFDDGLEDVYRVAYPELKEREIPFSIFIVTDFVNHEGYLNIEEIRQLANDPLVTICSHGLTHEVLRGMDTAQQRKELLHSKEKLCEWTGREVRYFAYSHGLYDEKTLTILQEENFYDYAFSAGGGVTNVITNKNRYTLPRMNCEDGIDSFTIENKHGRPCLVPKV